MIAPYLCGDVDLSLPVHIHLSTERRNTQRKKLSDTLALIGKADQSSDVHTVNREEALERVYKLAYEYEQKYGSCPQCVLAAIQEVFGDITDQVVRAAHGLAGGVGLSTQGTCGALSGGVMALSCSYGRKKEDFPKGRFLRSYALAKELNDRFLKEYGSTICRDVHTKVFGRTFNLWDRDDYDKFEEAGAHRDKCPSVTGNVAKWVAEILMDRGQSVADR